MSAFSSMSDALASLGKECIVLETGEHGLLNSLQTDDRVECPFGFFRHYSEVGAAPVVSSLTLTLMPASIAVGAESVGSTVATYDDGSTATVPAMLVSGTPATASVDGDRLKGLAAGTSSITSKYGGKTSGAKTLTVTSA